MRITIAILCLGFLPALLRAHPVPKSNHDRTVVVSLEAGPKADEVAVRVDYQLDVDPATVILEDMAPFRDDVDITRFKNRLDYFKEFTRIYAPILADRLVAKMNGSPFEFTCAERSASLTDDKGEPLDHLRCHFVFQAVVPCSPNQEAVFWLREANYQEQEGLIDLRLAAESNLNILAKTEADALVRLRQGNERLPGDEARLRTVEVHFRLGRQPAARTDVPAAPQTTVVENDGHDSGLLRLFLQSETGFWVLLLLAAYFGANHALTPGHGKTLMAAYLVGERGTLWHAVLLGTTTAITHTGIVLVLAVILYFLPAGMSEGARQAIQKGLGLAMGMAIVCLGFYLFLLRLSGRADHIHIGGTHHHHHHHGHSHHSTAHVVTAPGKLSAWGLILLGVSGGIVPCTDAVAMLVLAVGMNLFWLALPLLLAFSAGLAGMLVLVGVLVVKFRHVAGSRWAEGRLVRALPIVSALLVTAMGFWMCYESVR